MPTWLAVEAVTDNLSDSSAQKKKLARHGWCSFFIGLALAVQQAKTTLDEAKADLKTIVRSTILGSKSGKGIDARILDALVDKGWEHFTSALAEQSSGLSLISEPDLLRSLQIMAVFCCPAPEKHSEIRRYAIKPLEEDAEDMLKEEAKSRLREVLPDWEGRSTS